MSRMLAALNAGICIATVLLRRTFDYFFEHIGKIMNRLKSAQNGDFTDRIVRKKKEVFCLGNTDIDEIGDRATVIVLLIELTEAADRIP